MCILESDSEFSVQIISCKHFCSRKQYSSDEMTETEGANLGHPSLGNGCFDRFDQFMVLVASSGRGRLNGFECVWGNPSRIVLESIASLTPSSRIRCAGSRRCHIRTGPYIVCQAESKIPSWSSFSKVFGSDRVSDQIASPTNALVEP